MARAKSAAQPAVDRPRTIVRRRLDELEHDGTLTLDERLHIEAAARAAGVTLGSPAGRRRRPGS